MITNQTFSRRIALGFSAMCFLVIYPLLNGFAWEHLPHFARSNGSDFSQYYSAALSVKAGLRDNLYPKPNTDIYSHPPTFRPQISTPLFNPLADASRNGKWAFYPQIACPELSRVSEKLTSKYPLLQGNCHNISPPPLALLLYPLALFEYETACRFIWFPLMCTSLFGISFFSSKICRYIYKRETYIEAAVALLPVIPALLGSSQSTSLAIGNATPILGFLITLAAYAFLTNKQILLGFCIIPLVLFKGIGIAWCPLLLIGGIKWRTILTMGGLTLILNTLTLYLGGIDVYVTFFNEILPKANIPLGNGINGMLMKILGVDARLWITLIYAAFLFTLYILDFRALRRNHDPGLVSLTVLIASMALFNLFNTIVWPHYLSLYLFLPFAPWIIREISLRCGTTKKLMSLLIISIILCWMDYIFIMRQSVLVELLQKSNLYSTHLEILRKILSAVSFYVIPNAIATMVLLLAIRRLASWPAPAKPLL